MKKLLLLTVMAIAGLSANAQLVQGTTFTKKESNKTKYVRIGMSMNNAAGEALDPWKKDNYDIGTKVGYDIAFGFQKPIASTDAYWGMEFGLGTRGAKASCDEEDFKHDMSLLAHNVKISPITFGYKYGLTDRLTLDAHIGGYVSYDYAGKGKEEWWEEGWNGYSDSGKDDSKINDLESYKSFDAGLQIGVGVWFDRFNLDFTYQRGFLNVSEDDDLEDDNGDLLNIYSSNFMIRLGFAF